MLSPCPPEMHLEPLRRAQVPALSKTVGRVNSGRLPAFLKARDRIPRIHGMPISEPHNLLERAIETGQVWQNDDDPIRIETFDGRHDVLSLMVNADPGGLRLSSHRDRKTKGLTIYANGRPMVSLPPDTRHFSISDIRIIQST